MDNVQRPFGVTWAVALLVAIAPSIGHADFVRTRAGGLSGEIPALAMPIGRYGDVSFDAAGNAYVAHGEGNRVWKIDAAGVATVIAGTGVAGFSGDAGLAMDARLDQPSSAVADAGGNVFISDSRNNRIRRVDAATGTITTVATPYWPAGAAFGPDGKLYVALGATVERLDASGTMTRIAGNGAYGFSGDGGPATAR